MHVSYTYYEINDKQKKTVSLTDKVCSILIRYAWTIAECAQCSSVHLE